MTAPTTTANRETWLLLAIDALRPRFTEVGVTLPEAIRVSVGFGYGASRESATILGMTFDGQLSKDGIPTVFISPEVDDTARVLDILIHELIHVGVGCPCGHKGAFAEAATRLGLEGPMTATHAGVALAADLMCLAETLGDYAHAALVIPARTPARTPVGPDGNPLPRTSSGPKTQGTRMLKVVCPEDGYTVRTTRKWLEMGNPSCPCGTEMHEA